MALTVESALALISSTLKMKGLLPGLNDITWENASFIDENIEATWAGLVKSVWEPVVCGT